MVNIYEKLVYELFKSTIEDYAVYHSKLILADTYYINTRTNVNRFETNTLK